MKTSHLPLNLRVTIEIQDKDLNLQRVSIPATIRPGKFYSIDDIQHAASNAVLQLGGTTAITHTARLMRSPNGS